MTLKNIRLNLAYRVDTVRILGNMVAQLIEVLRYKPEGHGFDS
jgi:hypothetical protein